MKQFLKYWPKRKISGSYNILMNRRHYQKSMGNIQQLIDPEGLITFLKYDWLFEKRLTKSQNLNLYITYAKLSWFMANVSLTHACYTNLNSLDS